MIRTLALTLIASVAVASGAAAQGMTQKISKNLVNKAKDTSKEIEKVSKQLDKTVKQQNKLLSKKKLKDRQKEHRKLQDELKKTEEAVKEVRKKSDEMEKEADKFFKEWNEGIAEIDDDELRGMSQTRLDSSRSEYARIVGTGNLAASQYEEFLSGMKNELAFLDLDLSDDAIAQLLPKTRETQQHATALQSSMADLTRKIDGYVDALR